jgi:hypothetical protein
LNRFRKHISGVLLLAICFYTSPKELIHEFFHHDTIDCVVTHDGETSIGKEHFHCDLLQLTSPPFQQPLTSFSFYVSFSTFSFATQTDTIFIKEVADNYYLRGPPLIS